MADSVYVLCNPLCFLLHRYGRDAVKPLKRVLLDFYNVADLAAAKNQVLEDVKRMNKSVSIPHVPDRREGELRSVRIVDDIFTVLDCLDENQLLKHLPKYVADSPDAMPSARLYEGDLAVIMKLLERMDGQIGEFGSQMAAILKEVQAIQQPTTTGVIHQGLASSDAPGPTSVLHRQHASREVGGGQREPIASGAAVNSDLGNAISWSSTMSHKDWATVAVSSPVVTRNRFTAIETTDDEHDAQPFTTHESRSTKRRRHGTSPQQQSQQSLPTERVRQRGSRLMKGSSAPKVHRIAAAKIIVEKAVFCVDNVDPSVSVDDLISFVSRLKVNVFSCFPARPRRNRGELQPVTDRRAFRLCVAATDRDRLLDSSKWPDSVTISEWYYINPANDRRRRAEPVRDDVSDDTAAKRPLSPIAATQSIPAATAMIPTSAAANGNVVDLHDRLSAACSVDCADMDVANTDDNDTTVLYNNGAATSTSTANV